MKRQSDYLGATESFVGRLGFLPEDPSYVSGRAMESGKKHSGDLAAPPTYSLAIFPCIFTIHLLWFNIA